VVVTDFETGRSLGGSLAAFRGGRAGFWIADENPMTSGTVGTNERERKTRAHSALNTGPNPNETRRTFLTAWIMPTINLPLPYPLQISSGKNEGGRVASGEGRPLPRRATEPPMHRESGEHQKEDPKAQHESPSFATEPRDAHLMNARGVWNPQPKPATPHSWDWGRKGDEPR
jgi:hypothetical protein